MAYETSTVLRRDARGRGSVATPRESAPREIANVEFVTDYVAAAVSGLQPGGGQPAVVAGDIRFASQTPIVGTSGLPGNLGPSDYGKAYVVLVDGALRVYVWTGYAFLHLGADLSNYVLKDGSKVLSDNNFTDALKAKLASLTPDQYVLKDGDKVLSDNNFTDALREKLESIDPNPDPGGGDVGGLTEAVAGLSASVASVTTSVGGLASEQSRLSEDLTAISSDVARLDERVAAIETGGSGSGDLAIVQSALQELSNSVYRRDEVDDLLRAQEESTSNDLSEIRGSVQALSDSVYTKTEVDDLLKNLSPGQVESVTGVFDMTVPGDFYRLVVAVGRALGATVLEGSATLFGLAAGVVEPDVVETTTPIGLASSLGISYNDDTTLFNLASSIEGT